MCDDPLAACEDADALVVMTPWDEFADIDLTAVAERLEGRLVVDPFAGLDVAECERLGLDYRTLGVSPERKEKAA